MAESRQQCSALCWTAARMHHTALNRVRDDGWAGPREDAADAAAATPLLFARLPVRAAKHLSAEGQAVQATLWTGARAYISSPMPMSCTFHLELFSCALQ